MPATERLDIFTPFLKKERDADGVLWVEGKFTGPDLDSDGQRMDPTWLQSAIPAYMRGPSGGNVREGHSAQRPIGKAVEVWETDDHSWHMRAKIVDPVAEKKIEHGILAGFSIGVSNYGLAKAADAPNGKVCRGDVTEVSAVDRPSLPSALLRMATLNKATGSLDLVDSPEFVEGDDVEKTAEPATEAPGPQMLLKTSDGQVRPMTAALVDELTAPTVVANPDDPDAADHEALEKAKKGSKGVGNKKAPPFGADDKPKADDDSDDDSDTEDDDEKKKPATKAATPDLDAIVKAVLAELAKQQTTSETPTEPAAPADVVPDGPPVEKAAEPDLVKAADDELDDIARAKRILADLACLVQSEAAGYLAGGGSGEIWDMEMIVNVMGTLTCFVQREEEEAAAMAENTPDGGTTTPAPVPTVMQLAAEPDLLKAAANKVAKKLRKRLDKAAAAATQTQADAPATETTSDDAGSTEAVEKAAGTTDIEALTKAVAAQVRTEIAAEFADAITKAMGPVADGLAQVTATLHSTPRPGGPVVTRVAPAVPSEQLAKAAQVKARRDTYEGMLRGASTAGERAAISALIAELDKPAA